MTVINVARILWKTRDRNMSKWGDNLRQWHADVRKTQESIIEIQSRLGSLIGELNDLIKTMEQSEGQSE